MTAESRGAKQEARLFIVKGRVQGVNFRRFTAEAAKEIGLTGYARNLGDGSSVEVLAIGDGRRLDDLMERLKKGPPAARVKRVEWKSVTQERHYSTFEVL